MECGQMKEILENFQGEVNLSCSFNITCYILGRNMADFLSVLETSCFMSDG